MRVALTSGMGIGRVGRLAFIFGLIASAGAVGCFVSEEDPGEAAGRVTNGSVADALKSTLVLENDCMATKVGPRHLLTAARCVAGKPEFAAGKTIKFTVANKLSAVAPSAEDAGGAAGEAEEPADEELGDAGSDAARAPVRPRANDAGDAGADAAEESSEPTSGSSSDAKEVKIKKVEINASFTAKCSEGGSCAFKAIDASDAKDIAVIVLDSDLTSIPTVPIDLDSVGQTDKLLVVGSNCDTFDGEPTGVKTFKTVAVPARAVNHNGSPYRAEPQLTTRLNGAYVVTPGIGWRDDEPKVCERDIGAPVFRGATLAVAGVLSNYTTYADKDEPVTLHHTKVDKTSKVGTWLTSLGVETLKSCSETEDGCPKKTYGGELPEGVAQSTGNGGTAPGEGDGGVIPPKTDGGDAGETPPEPPGQGTEAPLPESSGDDYSSPPSSDDSSDSDYDAGAKKKKKKATSGCSAAPGSTPTGGDGIVLALGIAVASVVARRRRSS